jgi:hypothetical protein
LSRRWRKFDVGKAAPVTASVLGLLSTGQPIHASIPFANRTRIEGIGMTTQERLAKERKEIASRVANFKATQQKFQEEREEYYATTMENARNEPSRHA